MTDVFSDTAPTPPRRIRPNETWDAAREDYVAGATAEEVCRRHDLGLSAFKVRARQGEWRRADQPAPDPLDDTIDLDAPPEPRDSMLDKAWRRVSQALDAGRSTEAMRWMRLHAMLLEADRAEQRAHDRDTAQDMRAVTRKARDNETHAVATLRQLQADNPFLKRPVLKRPVHTVHSKKPAPVASAPPDPDEPGLSRAERRRRLKYRAKGP